MPILSRTKFAILAASLLSASATLTQAQSFETPASSAFVLDLKTQTVLLNKNADIPLPPASMSKLMTLYITFEALRDGRITMDTKLPVSQHAMDYAGSTMFLNTRDRVKVSDLIRGIIVLSGNDACAVIAEALSPDGTEQGFARFMTDRAQQMGMLHSTFANSNGWPDPNHRMSMHDLAILAERLIVDFPEHYPMFSERRFEFDGRAPKNVANRNPLLQLDIGADGLKTGHTKEAGYGLVGSAVQGDRRVIFVLSGLETAKARAEEAEAVLNWSFRQFAERKISGPEATIAQAPVWLGSEETVGLSIARERSILWPITGDQAIKGHIVFDGPIPAPVNKGQEIAHLILKPAGLPEIDIPLVANNTVEKAGFFGRIRTTAGIVSQQISSMIAGDS